MRGTLLAPLLIGVLLLSACGRGTEGPVSSGPEYSPQIPQPQVDGNLSDAFGKLGLEGLEGLEVPELPDIPAESALADPDLLNRALKAYRDLLAFVDRLLPVLEGAMQQLEGALGDLSAPPSATPPAPEGRHSLRDMVEGAVDQLKALRDLAGEMAAMLDFLKQREGHYSHGGMALSFESPEDARVYREYRRRVDHLSLRVREAGSL